MAIARPSRLHAVASMLIHEPVKAATLLVAVLVLVAVVGYPLFLVFEYSLYDQQRTFSLANYSVLLRERGIMHAAVNSFLLALYVPVGCIALGVPLAYVVARTNMPGKWLVRASVGAAFVIPSFITVLGWVFLTAPNSGMINKMLKSAFSLETPVFNVYTFTALVLIEIAHFFPIVFFAVTAALENIEASYEQAARTLGAGRFRTAATITIPLVGPAVLSSGILCSIDALSSFGAPVTLGLPGNFSVLTVKIYHLITDPPRLELAAALSLPVVIFTLLCLYVQRLYLRKNRFVTLSGKSTANQGIDLGRWRWWVFAACLLVCIVTVALPVVALAILSLLKTFGATVALKNLTIDNYAILFDPTFPFRKAFGNSFALALSAATACAALSLIFIWIVERTSLPGRGAITGTVMITYGLPPVALGVGVILAYSNVLFGTLFILIIGYIAKHLPISFVIIRNTIKQITPELEEAARISGASWQRSMRDITIPLLKPGMWIAWAMIFALSLRELSLSVLLVQPGTEVMSVAVQSLIDSAFLESAAAISILIIAFSVTSIFVAKKIAGRGVLEMR